MADMKVFYLRTEQGLPVAAVASALSSLNADTVVFAVSTYNPVDVFSKAAGREDAFKKLAIGGDTYTVQAGKGVKKRICRLIVNKRSTENKPAFPQRSREAARYWLRRQQER